MYRRFGGCENRTRNPGINGVGGARRRASAELERLKRLMIAILVDAIRCYFKKFASVKPRKRREFRQTRNWLFKERNDDFSSDSVCCILTDHEFLRWRLTQFR